MNTENHTFQTECPADALESFSLLIKPVSFHCNLSCRYCFYLPTQAFWDAGTHRMTKETLETITHRYLSCRMPFYQFGWQGGEPTLAGIDFFRNAVHLQQKYSRGAEIYNALQTNGTILNDEWGHFLHQYHFLTGISLDGPEKLHNCFRRYTGGRGSHADAERGLRILKRHGVEYNVLTLVSAANQDHPQEVYRYLRDLEIPFQQYTDCVEFDAAGNRQPYSLAQGKWGEFLCRIFDEWYQYDVGRISIRLFDSILSRLITGIPAICPMAGNCCNYLLIEYDGGVFPCDFHVRPEYRLGNVLQKDLNTLWSSAAFRAWGQQKEPKNDRCGHCRYVPLCMGDCPKNRRNGHSVLCTDWQVFYQHTIARFEELATRRRM